MDIETFLNKNNISAENGYAMIYTDLCTRDVALSEFKCVHISKYSYVYQPFDEVYLISYPKFNILALYYKKESYNCKKLIENIKVLMNYTNMYMVFNEMNEEYCTSRSIKNNDSLDLSISPLIDKITDKVLNHDATINIILHGKPGTGKSSCVEYMATKMDCDIYIINVDNLIKNRITALGNVKKSIILIPELDKYIEKCQEEHFLLELLCGCYTPSNCVIVITCNDYSVLKRHPIMTRPGRVHFSIGMGMINEELIKNITLKYFPEFTNFEIFNCHVGKVTVAEFKTAILNSFVLDIVPSAPFSVARMEHTSSKYQLYM